MKELEMGWRAAAEARLPNNKKVVVIVISGLIFVLALSAVLLSMSFGTGSNSPLSTSGSRPVLGGSTPSSTPSSSSSFSSSSSSSLNAVAQSGSAPASHGTTVIATNYNFYSTTYNSYTYWSQTIYADSVSYFPDHVNFTNGGFANATSPAWSFGTGVSGVNLTISQITNSSIELDDLGTPASTAFVYFYFSPSSYSVTQVNSISSSNFIANYANFLSCTAPCVYLNQTASYIEISNPTGVSTKNIVYLNGASSTTTTTTTTTTSSSIATTTTSTASSVTTTSPTTTTSSTTSTTTTNSSSSPASSSSSTTTIITSSNGTQSNPTSSSNLQTDHNNTTTSTSKTSPALNSPNNSESSPILLSPLGDSIIAYLGVLLVGSPLVVRIARKSQGSGESPVTGWRW